ncbi:UDP-3-O-acyl-N-acetylglucosamine deacetylase [Primorskyibacter sp. S187A]|uniref:UDP-3-O-acyl-N-acetylglucosamine deacetylase n=1 Tax=Primorskyibacter sp. S187A TaxID=3415130 RepID=UPI003C7A257D
MQTTLKSAIRFSGVGLHSGQPVTMRVCPASADYGIWFRRTDVMVGDALVPARWDQVELSPLCTKLVNAAGVSISTVEHLMAALAGCGIHNALIEIDGPEVPILDGSSAQFVDAFLSRGLQGQGVPVRAIRVMKSVTVETPEGWARLAPGSHLSMEFEIDFDEAAIGKQRRRMSLANGAFVRELCDSRTFCRRIDVDTMRANGLALGGVPGVNAVVFDGAEVQSGQGLRHADEPVRHKMLDAVGDLALAGAPILGTYTGVRSGHAMTNRLLRALFETPGAIAWVECDPSLTAMLPGVGVRRDEVPAVA